MRAKNESLALSIRNFEYVQSCGSNFQKEMKSRKAQPKCSSIVHRAATPLGKACDAGPVAPGDPTDRQSERSSARFGGNSANSCGARAHPRHIQEPDGEIRPGRRAPEYLDPSRTRRPVGLTVTGYLGTRSSTPGAQWRSVHRGSEEVQRLSAVSGRSLEAVRPPSTRPRGPPSGSAKRARISLGAGTTLKVVPSGRIDMSSRIATDSPATYQPPA